MNKKCHTKAWLNKEGTELFPEGHVSAAVLFCGQGKNRDDSELSRISNAHEFFLGVEAPESEAEEDESQSEEAAAAAREKAKKKFEDKAKAAAKKNAAKQAGS